MAGRHKGTPKTGGRQKGTPNKSTAGAKEFVALVEGVLKERGVQGYDSLENIAATLLTCGVPATIERVWEKLMEYKYGKPTQSVDVGASGGLLHILTNAQIPNEDVVN